jgi:hypothetical protein
MLGLPLLAGMPQFIVRHDVPLFVFGLQHLLQPNLDATRVPPSRTSRIGVQIRWTSIVRLRWTPFVR